MTPTGCRMLIVLVALMTVVCGMQSADAQMIPTHPVWDTNAEARGAKAIRDLPDELSRIDAVIKFARNLIDDPVTTDQKILDDRYRELAGMLNALTAFNVMETGTWSPYKVENSSTIVDQNASANRFQSPPPWRPTFSGALSHISGGILASQRKVQLPCRWLIDDYRLFDLERNFAIGRISDASLYFDCPDDLRPLPNSVQRWWKLASDAGDRTKICGTLSIDIGREITKAWRMARFSPENALRERPSLDPLKDWRLLSVWNWRRWNFIQSNREKALDDLTAMYREIPSFKLDGVRGLSVADQVLRVLQDRLQYGPGPLPDGALRLAILEQAGTAAFDLVWTGQTTSSDPLVADPLPHIAVNDLESMVWLGRNGFDLDVQNAFGKTTLMVAAHHDQLAAIRYLVGRGADPNAQTLPPKLVPNNDAYWGCSDFDIKHGARTALMYAAEDASLPVIEALLDAGADPCLADTEGLRPFDYLDGRAPSGDRNRRLTAEETAVAARRLACPVP